VERLESLLNLLFSDSSPEDRVRVLRVMFRISVAGSLLWAWGFFAAFGLTGFAKASEIDEKILKAVQPVQTQLVEITSKLSQQDEVLRSIRIDQLSTKLRELKRTNCALGNGDQYLRSRMESEIERAQLEYASLTGGRYPLPDCEKL
jgi:hypothetical protein